MIVGRAESLRGLDLARVGAAVHVDLPLDPERVAERFERLGSRLFGGPEVWHHILTDGVWMRPEVVADFLRQVESTEVER